MNRISLLSALAILVSTTLFSQSSVFEDYDWQDYDYPTITTDEEKEILFIRQNIECTFEDELFVEYYTYHRREYLNSDEQIKRSNKKYISYREGNEIYKARARVIKPDNSVLVLSDSMLHTGFDETSNIEYTYFAFEGLEKGNIIEYYYIIRKDPGYNGKMRTIQAEYPLRQYEFNLYSPSHLIFDFKLYNDTTDVVYDTLPEDYNHWSLELSDIPAYKEETFEPCNDLLIRINYKLDENTANGNKDMTSYGEASQTLYTRIYENYDKADIKALGKLFKELKIKVISDDEEKIRKIETYLKSNISMNDFSSPKLDNISNILKTRNASERGMTKLITMSGEQLGIKSEIVLTCDRSYCKFDKDFEAYNFLQDYLIYFPSFKKFIAPGSFTSRLGLLPHKYTDNYGLFIKGIRAGDSKIGFGKVKFIPPSHYEISYNDLSVNVSFEDDFMKVNIEVEKRDNGHYALSLQPYLYFMDEESRDETIENYLKAYFKDMDIEEFAVKNYEPEDIGVNPLVCNFHGTYNELIQIAGSKLIFKVGDLIGPQMELYSEKERKQPVYSKFKRIFRRQINIEIPEAYKIVNADDLKIYADYDKDGKKVLLFESDYKINGNMLEVTVNEYYDQLYFTLEEYPVYRKVINSASDFNKVELVFEKK